jgi:site-specific DNA-cytosine methylase
MSKDPAPYPCDEPRPHRPFHCIDLFAGCGGLSLGLEIAGFEPLLFSEINKDAAATYKANRGSKIVEVETSMP